MEAKLLEGHAPRAQLQSVCANLTKEPWEEELLARGFRGPSSWLLEGLTGYLTQEELEHLLGTLSKVVPWHGLELGSG